MKTHRPPSRRRSPEEMRRARWQERRRVLFWWGVQILGLALMGGGVAGGARVLLKDGVQSRWWLGGLLFVTGNVLLAWSVNLERRFRGKPPVGANTRVRELSKILPYGFVEIIAMAAVCGGLGFAVREVSRSGWDSPWWQGAVLCASGLLLANMTAKWLGFLKPKRNRKTQR